MLSITVINYYTCERNTISVFEVPYLYCTQLNVPGRYSLPRSVCLACFIRAEENKIKFNILDQKYEALKGTLAEANKVEIAKIVCHAENIQPRANS